jgi:N-carbamoyl-L-amino-acid hydrolase
MGNVAIVKSNVTFNCTLMALLFAGNLWAAESPAGDDLRVNGERLNATMEHMKTFGMNETGGSARVAFSDENRAALAYLSSLMSQAGLETRIDVAGNLVGRREGKTSGLAPIVSGSHVDTVPNGGHYDGVVGVMSAIEVARALHEAGFELDHPLEIVVWSNEEGGKTGSRSYNGSVEDKEFDLAILSDTTIGDGVRYLGGNPERLSANVREAGGISSYVELHVEQGAFLDKENISIGVVQGIVGIRRWNITIDGFANHAGTTPMDQRQDALYAAALLIAEVRRIITEEPGRQVGTVGSIQAFPGAPNVIPGQVKLSLEIRDLDMDKIETLFQRIRSAANELSGQTDTTIAVEQYYESPAAITDERIKNLIQDSADALGLSAMHMPSGAGHDAQSLAGIAPLGMIFVPSKDGISHAPAEFTSGQQITNGANVLLQSIVRMDRQIE